MTPLISVVVPVYNVGAYLARCLDSVLAQTFQYFEIICVDDASTDNSHEVLLEYAAKDSRFQILRNGHNGGLSYTRNVGLGNARGKYVYFLDSDDAIIPDCLKKAYDTAEATDADIVAFGAVEKEAGKKDRLYSFPEEMCSKVWDGKKLFVELHGTKSCICPIPFNLWRKSFLTQFNLKFYEGIYHEDNLFSFFALISARKVVCLPDLFYLYYHHDGSIMRKKLEFKHIASLIVIAYEMRVVLKKEPCGSSVKRIGMDNAAHLCAEAERRMSAFGLKNLPDGSELFNEEEQKLYELLRGLAQVQYRYSLSDDDYEHLKSFEHVLVYGAGKVARKVLPGILDNGIKTVEVVVSSGQDNEASLYGVPVRRIKDLTYPKKNCIVVIAVGAGLSAEIKKDIVNLGYADYLFADKTVEGEM